MRNYHLLLILMQLPAGFAQAADWPQWRGPYFNGSTDEMNLPTDWSRTEGIAWSVELPGCSAATPVIYGDKVYLSGLDSERDMLLAMCFDLTDGELLWQNDIKEGASEIERSTFAAPSAVTDGQIVVFFYGNGDLVCFDTDGNNKWQRNIQEDYGPFAFLFTFSSTPTLYKDKLYLQVLQRDVAVSGRGLLDQVNESYLLAMNPQNGETLWRHIRPSQARQESREAYSTPIPFSINDTEQLLIAGGDAFTGHDIETGEELWRWGNWNPSRITHWRLVPSPVAAEDIVIVCAPKGSPVYAIEPNQQGVYDDSAIVWNSEGVRDISSDVPTPAFYDGDFFVLNDQRGSLSRVEPRTGNVKWTIRAPGDDKYEASPLAADDKIYIINHAGEVSVIEATDGEVLNTIVMDEPAGREIVRSSISAAHGRLFIRTTRHLYCVGQQSQSN